MDTTDLKNSALYDVFLDDLDQELGRYAKVRLDAPDLKADEVNNAGIAFHKLKVSASIMGFSALSDVAAAIENLLRKDSRTEREKSDEFDGLMVEFKRLRGTLPPGKKKEAL